MRRIALPALLFAVGATLILAAILRPPLEPGPFHGTYLPGDAPPVAVTLEAEQGRVSLADFRDRAVLVFFGYTSCPDVCPLTMAKLRRVMELLGEARDEVLVVFVSVDPEVDSIDRTRDYARAFDHAFIGLTGDVTGIREAARSFGVYVGDPEPGPAEGHETGHEDHGPDATGTAGARLIAHSPHVFGLDRRGVRRLVWNAEVTAEQLADDVRTLLRL